MPYIEIETNAGGIIEKKKTFSARYGQKGIKRSQNTEPTREAVQKVNDDNAETNLRHILYCNFQNGYHLTGTYKKENRPTPEQAKAHVKKFFKQARKYFRDELGKEFKYVLVTEYENSKAIHHHIIVEGVDIRPLQKMWKEHGALRSTMIADIEHLTRLASYLIKETKNRYTESGRHVRRYATSRNLIKPKVTKRVISANAWRAEPKPYKGYYLDKLVGDGQGFYDYENLLNGMQCQFIRMLPYIS